MVIFIVLPGGVIPTLGRVNNRNIFNARIQFQACHRILYKIKKKVRDSLFCLWIQPNSISLFFIIILKNSQKKSIVNLPAFSLLA